MHKLLGFLITTTFVRTAFLAITVGTIRGHVRRHIILAHKHTSYTARMLHHDQRTSFFVGKTSVFTGIACILALKYKLCKTTYKNLKKDAISE